METYDVIVVGGGAAGMMAAGRAGERGRRVLLLEKNEVLGAKLSTTGGGRCNITHAEFDNRILLVNYGDAEKFLYATFSRFAVEQTFTFFAEHGLPLIVEAHGRAFPQTQRARDVTGVMERYLHGHDVTVRTGTAAQSVRVSAHGLEGIETGRGFFRANAVILATGGLSHKHTGATGDGFQWLRDLGHTVYPPNPNVVPLRVKESWVKKLSGVSLSPVRITFFGRPCDATAQEKSGRMVRTGEVLFTHFGLSGPMILNAAHEVKKLLSQGSVTAQIDLFPEADAPKVDARVREVFATHRSRILRNALPSLCPKGMARGVASLVQEAQLNKQVSQITQAERKGFVHLLKGLPLTVTGTMGYDWAVISDGGVPLKEIDTRTMRSRLHPNLYIVGDLLHINRPSGGYSLQLCWTTGWVAGEHV